MAVSDGGVSACAADKRIAVRVNRVSAVSTAKTAGTEYVRTNQWILCSHCHFECASLHVMLCAVCLCSVCLYLEIDGIWIRIGSAIALRMDISYFSSIFKRVTGVSPSVYQDSCG